MYRDSGVGICVTGDEDVGASEDRSTCVLWAVL